jgi:hypothetical protein
MSLLYGGNYYKRFDPIRKLIKGKSVTELCFGDTVIADFCRKNNIEWTGYDINAEFINNAVNKGLNAYLKDVNTIETFGPSDICMMIGSFYHFHLNPEKILRKMLDCSKEIIISEPVINLSDRKGLIGKLAKASANVNGKKQSFRYTETSLLKLLDSQSKELGFTYKIAGYISKDLIIVIYKK